MRNSLLSKSLLKLQKKFRCMVRYFCCPLRQHSCCRLLKRPHQLKRNYLGTFSWKASMIASKPLHKASLSFRGGKKMPGGNRKKFLTDPPFPASSRTPPLVLPPLWKFFSPSLLLVSFHCRSPSLPHLVVVSVDCLTYPYFSSSPSPFPLYLSTLFSSPPPDFFSRCQDLFSMESYICFFPFSHPTCSQMQLQWRPLSSSIRN